MIAGCAVLAMTLAVMADAQQPAPAQNPTAEARGRQTFGVQCAPCHGPEGRGGLEGATDLTRSPILLANDAGRQFIEFLKVGRPERRMPAFSLSDAEVGGPLRLHSAPSLPAPGRGGGGGRGVITAVVVGDAKAGEAYFNGAGGCKRVSLADGRFQRHRNAADRSRPSRAAWCCRAATAGIRASFNSPPDPNGRGAHRHRDAAVGRDASRGTLMWITDFSVTLTRCVRRPADRRAATATCRRSRSRIRCSGTSTTSSTLTDKDMHDLTAYLVTLK